MCRSITMSPTLSSRRTDMVVVEEKQLGSELLVVRLISLEAC